MRACLDENTVLELIEGTLDDGRSREVAAHIDECSACRALVAQAAGDLPAESGPLKRGTTLGRHVILEAVGAGAMGAVYAAYDPELERKVAIKLLRADEGASAEGRARLVREAQALAKLQHPNVITVHEVGSAGDRVYLAMELVDGTTLGAWLGGHPARDQVIDKLLQAGQGLAAAHAVGLVHRDFKPDNVLVGRDGRVRVTDFGLARIAATATGGEPLVSSIAGTPAYMAPEVRAGAAATALSDQYSFCVTLHEALTGARPPATGKALPGWLRRLIERGLLPDPEARFPSLQALLDGLAAGPRLRLRRMLPAALALALLALAAVAVRRLPPAPRCDGGAAAWGEVWNQAERAAFRRTAGSQLFATVDGGLQGYRAAFIAMHDQACRATRVRGEQSEAMLDRRVACLSRARGSAAALAQLLGTVGAAEVGHSAAALARLPSIEACADTAALMARVPPPRDPAQRSAVEAVDAQLDGVQLLCDLNRGGRALEIARSVEPAVAAAGYPPLEARRLMALGIALYKTGPLDDAEAALHRAAVAAEAAHDDALLADAWTLLARIAGFRRGHPDQGKLWLAYSGAAIDRLGGDDRREADRAGLQALLSWSHVDEARALIERARQLTERSCKQDCYRVADYDVMLANQLLDTGRPEEAIPIYRRTRARLEAALGPDANGLPLINEATALTYAGHPDQALPLYRRIIDAGQGNGDGFVHQRMGEALRRLGRLDEALAEDRLALSMAQHVVHADDPAMMMPLLGEGSDLRLLGRYREALPPLERAVALGEKFRSPDELGDFHFALAQALWEAGGDRARARRLASQAVDEMRPDAQRFGHRFQAQLAVMEGWLAAHK